MQINSCSLKFGNKLEYATVEVKKKTSHIYMLNSYIMCHKRLLIEYEEKLVGISETTVWSSTKSHEELKLLLVSLIVSKQNKIIIEATNKINAIKEI